MALLIHPEDLLLRCRNIAQISTANPATKMAATHHGPTPVGMGRRMMITQIHHGQDTLLPGPSIFGLPSDSSGPEFTGASEPLALHHDLVGAHQLAADGA
jgi:hypothetical protein